MAIYKAVILGLAVAEGVARPVPHVSNSGSLLATSSNHMAQNDVLEGKKGSSSTFEGAAVSVRRRLRQYSTEDVTSTDTETEDDIDSQEDMTSLEATSTDMETNAIGNGEDGDTTGSDETETTDEETDTGELSTEDGMETSEDFDTADGEDDTLADDGLSGTESTGELEVGGDAETPGGEASLGPAAAVPGGFPQATGEEQLTETVQVSGTFDGGLKRYQLSGGDQGEGQDPLFKLAPGATIKNVIIGDKAADGIHCYGDCVIENCWWEDVGEDAATFKEGSGIMLVSGGGAMHAEDKVFQHNAAGTLAVENFMVEDFGKLVRSCGTCGGPSKNKGNRKIIIKNVDAKDGAAIAGINVDKGDSADISDVRATGVKKTCEWYEGTKSVGEGNGNGCSISGMKRL